MFCEIRFIFYIELYSLKRQDAIRKIESGAGWDVIVIGGGATGLGIALKPVPGDIPMLLEQSDFAKGHFQQKHKINTRRRALPGTG